MSSSARGRAGKYNKARRGGGRQFTKGLRPLDKDGAERSMWADDAEDSSEEDSSEEDSSEESSSDEDAPKQSQAQGEMTREEKRAAAKARKEAAIRKKKGTPAVGDMPSDSEEESEEDADMPANPNHTASARKMAEKAVADPAAAAAKPDGKAKKPDDMSQLSRREREAFQKQQAKERYEKLHAEGKTEEARADMERLKLVRQQREEATARKEAEKQEKEMMEKEKKEQLERMERQAKLKAARGGKGAKKGGKA